MAGIGFELRKLVIGRGAIRKIRAYAYAGVITSGTMLLASLLLLGIQGIAKGVGAPEHERDTLVVMMIYALLFSMILTGCFQTFLSRYTADMLYREKPERVMPSLIGASLTLMLPGGLLYGLLLWKAPQIELLDRLLNWVFFMELIPFWLEMSYITAAKEYKRILLIFLLGVGLTLGLGWGLCAAGLRAITALLLALVVGYGVMLTGFMGVLLRYFPAGSGSVMAYLSALDETADLLLTGFALMLGAFIHMMLMWFSPLGTSVTGPFRQAASFDAAAFYAFLVTVPANINFIVSVEVNFYEKYRDYFSAITGGGTLREMNRARDSMTLVLRQELFKLLYVQLFFMTLHVVLMRFWLERIGFTTEMIAMFQVMSIGYSGYAIGNCVLLLQLYFNDRKGAMGTALIFCMTNLIVTLLTMNGKPLYYGVGLVAAGIAMFGFGLPRLLYYVKDIDYHVFCAQPVLAETRSGFWTRLTMRLDAGARGSRPQKTHAKEAQA